MDGDDDCREVYVSSDDIRTLIATCEEVLKDRNIDIAKDLLPNTEGFFFGSQEYDEYYFEDIAQVLKDLKAIDLDRAVDFYYRASW
jgi:hypothetical protein